MITPDAPSIVEWWYLREHRPAPVGEALDDVDLPQRPTSIHVSTDDARHLIAELVGGTGRSETDVADVVVEVEVGVVDPVRMVEPERDVDESATHRRQVADQGAEPFVDHVERFEVGRRSLVDRPRR